MKTFTKYFHIINNLHIKEIIKSSSISLIIQLFGIFFTFIFSILVARQFGSNGMGIYSISLSIIVILSVISRVGLDNTLIRHIAIYTSDGLWGKNIGLYRQAVLLTSIFSLIITFFLFITSPWFTSSLFDKPELMTPLRIMAIAILPFALFNIHSSCLVGLKKIKNAMLIRSAILPLTSVVVLYFLSFNFGNINAVMISYLAGTIITLIIGIYFWNVSIHQRKDAVIYMPFKKILESCTPFFIISFTNLAILPWAPILIMGIWTSSDEVGIYSAASRISIFVGFLLAAVNNVIAPKYAELYKEGKNETLGDLAYRFSIFLTIISIPIFFVIIFNGGSILVLLFGDEFRGGSQALTILACGQMVSVACGSVGVMLNMSGYANYNSRITILSGILLIFLTLVLIPSWGGIGAAIATTSSVTFFNITALLTVRNKLKIKASWLGLNLRKTN